MVISDRWGRAGGIIISYYNIPTWPITFDLITARWLRSGPTNHFTSDHQSTSNQRSGERDHHHHIRAELVPAPPSPPPPSLLQLDCAASISVVESIFRLIAIMVNLMSWGRRRRRRRRRRKRRRRGKRDNLRTDSVGPYFSVYFPGGAVLFLFYIFLYVASSFFFLFLSFFLGGFLWSASFRLRSFLSSFSQGREVNCERGRATWNFR